MKLNKMIDHTILKPDATIDQVKKVICEAKKYDFASVCIPPMYCELAQDNLRETSVKVCTVIGFPLGYQKTSVKMLETVQAIEDGASEIDLVVNIAHIKNKNWDKVEAELLKIREITKTIVLKVIFETALLNNDEKIKLCQICSKIKVDFVKTSTGFSTGGATIEDINLFKNNIDKGIKIKASGGVRSYEDAIIMIDSGATRIGTSNGVEIMLGLTGKGEY
jgi:deoxyribose-phosphate aldolase